MQPFHLPDRIEILAIDGIPEVYAGAPLAELLLAALDQSGLRLEDGDLLAVAHKIVSKSEGRLVALDTVQPSPLAESLAASFGKDARQIEIVLRESRRIVRMDAGLILSETHHGFICANAGVDTSNVPAGFACLLPSDPDRSACKLWDEIAGRTGKRIAVLITDTFGRPWREGLTNVAIGIAGFAPLLDYRGQRDEHGHLLSATVIAAADELAGAAELVMGKTSRRPAAIIRNYSPARGSGAASELIRPAERDLFR